jgi:hypothetical protein
MDEQLQSFGLRVLKTPLRARRLIEDVADDLASACRSESQIADLQQSLFHF